MSPSSFLSWLDKEIESVRKWKTMGGDPFFYAVQDAVLSHLSAVQDKAKSLQYPPQPIDPEQNEINKFLAKD
jgi:hypothetical protein